MNKILFTLFCLSQLLISQEDKSVSIAENANAIIQNYELKIQIINQKKYVYKEYTEILVLNELGNRHLDLNAYFDKSTKIKSIEAKVYGKMGNEIKTIKRKDYRDISVGDGFSIFNDNRLLYYDYTPISYPYRMVIEKEIESSNTAFLPRFIPQGGYYLAVKKATLQVNFPTDLGFRFKKYQFPNTGVTEKLEATSLFIQMENIKARKREDVSPSFREVMPKVQMAITKFHLEGVDGEASTWEEFGKWYSQSILKNTHELPEETKQKVIQATAQIQDPLEKAKWIYEYVQSKTRYVSVQVGIGGWKPMLARDVDKLGYGDCKALTNYTKSLLDVVGIPSYYTVVHAESDFPINLDEDFVSMQGNHAILGIPINNDYVWLECTSQTQPFGFQGNFTDNRKVLVIKEDKGEIVHTKAWVNEQNYEKNQIQIQIQPDGSATANLVLKSFGLNYDARESLERLSAEKRELHYKDKWSYLNGLKLQQIEYANQKKELEFTEKITLSVPNYSKKLGNDYVFVPNMVSPNRWVPQKYKSRENNFAIYRGSKEMDEVLVEIPTDFSWTFVPKNHQIENEYGFYEIVFEKVNAQKIRYKRTFLIKKGSYNSDKYESFRAFMEEVSRNDQAKLIYQKN